MTFSSPVFATARRQGENVPPQTSIIIYADEHGLRRTSAASARRTSRTPHLDKMGEGRGTRFTSFLRPRKPVCFRIARGQLIDRQVLQSQPAFSGAPSAPNTKNGGSALNT